MSKMGEYFMEKYETDPDFRKKVDERERQSDIGEGKYFSQVEQENK